MAGYSGTPLPKKLDIKEGTRLALVQPPTGFFDTLGELPGAAVHVAPAEGHVDVAVLFVKSFDDLAVCFGPLAAALKPAGGLWVAWPKRTSGVATDLDENIIRDFGLAAGLVDNKVCAIDDTWSGLRFVYRLKDRPNTK